ncbi:C4-dicarboxylate ABC transporter [Paradesulfitobacterium aromaticivorans]
MAYTLTRVRSGITFFLAVSFLFNLFLKANLVDTLNIILMALVLAFGLLAVTGTARVIGYFSFIVSAILLVHAHAPLSIWAQGLQENLYLVVMFTLVPLLGIPIRHGGYTEALKGVFMRYVSTDSRFYLLISVLTSFLAVLINLAVIPLLHQISSASAKSNDKKLLTSALSRGFAACTVWAPTTAGMALILQLTKAEWHIFFPFALFLGVLAGAVGYIMAVLEQKKKYRSKPAALFPMKEVVTGTAQVQPSAASEQEIPEELNWRKVGELSAYGAVLITLIVVVSGLTGIATVVVVAMASLVFPVIWMAMIGKLPLLAQEFAGDYFKDSLPKLKSEIVLFVGAGFLATSVGYSHIGDYVPLLLQNMVGNSAELYALVVVFGILVFAVVGIHPIITTTIIGSTVDPLIYGISPTLMALIFTISWAMGISISPSAGNVIAISGLAERSPVCVGPVWNGPYGVISSVVLVGALFLMQGLGWM